MKPIRWEHWDTKDILIAMSDWMEKLEARIEALEHPHVVVPSPPQQVFTPAEPAPTGFLGGLFK